MSERIDEVIALSASGIRYDEKFLKKYAYVFCGFCGKSICGSKDNDGIIRSLIHQSCFTEFRRCREKLNAKINKKTNFRTKEKNEYKK